MSMSSAARNDWLKLLFQNIDWANMGDAGGLRGSASPGNFYISLHTADPTAGGDQTSSETVYTNYTRIAVVRTVSGFTVTANQVSNAAEVLFPECGVTGAALTHFAVGRASAGAGEILASGALGATLNVANLIAPRFSAGGLVGTAT